MGIKEDIKAKHADRIRQQSNPDTGVLEDYVVTKVEHPPHGGRHIHATPLKNFESVAAADSEIKSVPKKELDEVMGR